MPRKTIRGRQPLYFGLMTVAFALALTATSLAADVSSDVTFYDALYDLAYQAKESNRLVQHDNLESRPFKTPAYRLLERITEAKVNAILWGFGNELTSAVAKVLSVGGATTTAEIIGLIKDAANSHSLADFLLKAGPKKAWTTLRDKFKDRGEIEANAERLANKAMDQLFKKIQLANSNKRVVSSSTTGGCTGGSERLTVDLNAAKGEAVASLEAKGCTCTNRTALSAYSARVVGSFSPRFLSAENKLNWRFGYRTSSFSGTPCNNRDRAVVKIWERIAKGSSTAPLPGSEKPSVCTVATCTFLVGRLDQDERVLQRLACRVGRLRREKRTDSDEYVYVEEKWNGISTSQTGAFAEYARCHCDNAGVPKKVFQKKAFLQVISRSIRPPYKPPPIPVSNAAYCAKCDPTLTWIGKWKMWGTVEISKQNGALQFNWKTTYPLANPIKTSIESVTNMHMMVKYKMAGGFEEGVLDLTLRPDGKTFKGIRKREGVSLTIVGERDGKAYCAAD